MARAVQPSLRVLATALFAVSCVSALLALASLSVRFRVPVLERLDPPEPAMWPKVSVVIAARDEVDHLEAAIATRLADDYPDLEIVVVDDRSTDGTGELVDRIAAADPRVTAVHVDALPDGWLGKVHAMHRGIEAARGGWILLSDADVHVAPGTMRRAIAWAEQERLDHLTALPTVWEKGLVFDAVLAAFVRLVMVGSLITPAGVGAFNLMRRRAYDASPGMSALRMEVGDDIELARLLVASGAKSAWVNGRRLIHLEFYPTIGAMTQSLEKAAGVRGAHPFVFVLASLVYLLVEVAPFAGLAFEAWRWPSLAIGALVMAVSATMNRWFDQPGVPALFSPIGALVGAWMLFRAGLFAFVRGGIYWRGTFYSRAALRGQTTPR